MTGWLFCKNLDCSVLNNTISGNLERTIDGLLFTALLDKFSNDIIRMPSGFFLEGYIVNKKDLIEMSCRDNWEDAFVYLCQNTKFPLDFRGGFCGFYKNEINDLCFFTDHTGSKALYYYYNDEKLIVSTRIEWMTIVLKANKIKYHFDEQAAKYIMTYGYMLDDTTFVSEIKRILPGNKIFFGKNKVNVVQYYTPSINNPLDISEKEAIDLIDESFKQAVRREFEKDKEYGYEHLVDLSGGLDSRMVTWVAHEIGFEKQTNFSYSKAGYLDNTISSRIAMELKHEYYFKQLDDFQWIYPIEDILRLNSGAALYSGITGGRDFISTLNCNKFGIEHTGMIGDVVISCFGRNESQARRKPEFGKRQYSYLLHYNFPDRLLDNFENQEIFDIYTRGFLGAQSTYSIRQNYLEVASPFLDVDFLDTCFRIPIKFRARHNIYLKWINCYYKDATRFGWESWAGVWPKPELALIKDGMLVLKIMQNKAAHMLGIEATNNMNPVGYWYRKDTKVQHFFRQYYENTIQNDCFTEELRKDITYMFQKGNAVEKTQALTALGMARLLF